MFNIRIFVIRQATPPAQPEDKKEAARPLWKWTGRLGKVIALLASGGHLVSQLPINFF